MLASSLWGQNDNVRDQAPAEPSQRLLQAIMPPPSPSLLSHCFLWWSKMEKLRGVISSGNIEKDLWLDYHTMKE